MIYKIRKTPQSMDLENKITHHFILRLIKKEVNGCTQLPLD